jgi:S1-C subfamily serine protease
MRLTVRSGAASGTTIHIAGALVVGREDGCDLVLDDPSASRRHARITPSAAGVIVEDLGSRNGTYVAGDRICGSVSLEPGGLVQIGDTILELLADEPAAAEPVTSGPPSPSVVERVLLRRSARTARIVAAGAVAALVAAVAVVVLLVTGVVGGDSEPTVADVVAEATPSVVQVRLVAQDGRSFAAGTGWVYDAATGLVVTNAHVTRAGAAFAVRLGTERRDRPATLVGVAVCDDLSVLRVEDTSGMRTLPLGSQADLDLGETVVALGYPLTGLQGSQLVATRGVVSVAKAPSVELADYDFQAYPNVVQTDAVINAGNSGGPLVDLETQLVGVNTFRRVPITENDERYEIQDFAIGVDRVREVVPQLAAGKSLGWFGTDMLIEYVTAEEKSRLGLPDLPGIVVDAAVPGTSGARAGFGTTPLLVVAVDGRQLSPPLLSWCAAAGTKTEGDRAVLSVVRSGETEPRELEVEFE